MNVEFTPEAISDLRGIHEHIAEFDIRTADRVISRIRQVITTFEGFPQLGRPGSIAGTREFAISGLPYTVVYSIRSASQIDILTVIHQSRKYPPDEA